MDKTTEFINGVLEHAAAPYDPVKRREYYLRTRELKGRQKGSGSTTSPKSSKGSVTAVNVRIKLNALSAKYKTEAKAIANEAKERLAKANESHTRYKNALEKQRAEGIKKAQEQAAKKIAALPYAGSGASVAVRARVNKRRSDAKAKIKKQLGAQVKKVNSYINKELAMGQKEVDDNREEVLGEAKQKLSQLKDRINKDRARVLSQTKSN